MIENKKQIFALSPYNKGAFFEESTSKHGKDTISVLWKGEFVTCKIWRVSEFESRAVQIK